MSSNHTIQASLISLVFLIAGCDAEEGNIFNKKSSYSSHGYQISEAVTLTEETRFFKLDPSVKVKKQVQYITLSLPSANLWKPDAEKGTLLNASGEELKISVNAQSESGTIYPFDSISIGKELMFSYLPSNQVSNEPGLPKGEVLVSVNITSDTRLDADAIGWLDITNK